MQLGNLILLLMAMVLGSVFCQQPNQNAINAVTDAVTQRPTSKPTVRHRPSYHSSTSSSDLTLIWMVIFAWLICLCLYAATGEENSAAATRRRRALARAREQRTAWVSRMSSRSDQPLPDGSVGDVARADLPDIPYSQCITSIVTTTEAARELDSCCICLESFELSTVVKKLECGHIYHPACINLWLEVSTLCPLCRSDSLRGALGRTEGDTGHVELVVRGEVTTLQFTALLSPDVMFGVTVASTANGLLVTYVEPHGRGAAQGVHVGDYLTRQDGVLIPRAIGDGEFVDQLVSLARPVNLGFSRHISDHQGHDDAGATVPNQPNSAAMLVLNPLSAPPP